MPFFPIFLSLVCVVRDQSAQLDPLLTKLTAKLGDWVSDCELIVIDNASSDDSVAVLRQLTEFNGLPNLQIYALTKQVEMDTAAWVGLENALGDFVAVFDTQQDDIDYLPVMLERAVSGADVVFAANQQRPHRSSGSGLFNALLNDFHKFFHGFDLTREAPSFRLLNKRVISFILEHPHPWMTYHHLPATGGFNKVLLSYSSDAPPQRNEHLGTRFDHGMRLLMTSTRAPLRWVTGLALLGALINLLACLYQVLAEVMGSSPSDKWVWILMQQSVMFFMVSLVLFVVGEYIINMASLTNEGPAYHVGQEFTSARMTRHQQLNVVGDRIDPADPVMSPKAP